MHFACFCIIHAQRRTFVIYCTNVSHSLIRNCKQEITPESIPLVIYSELLRYCLTVYLHLLGKHLSHKSSRRSFLERRAFCCSEFYKIANFSIKIFTHILSKLINFSNESTKERGNSKQRISFHAQYCLHFYEKQFVNLNILF